MTVQTTAPDLPGTGTPARRPGRATSRISQWVTELGHAAKAAEAIVDTPLCPDAWWPLPAGVKLWTIPDRNPRLRLTNEDEGSFRPAPPGGHLDWCCGALGGRVAGPAHPGCRHHRCLRGGWEAVVVRRDHARDAPLGGLAVPVIDRSATRGAVATWRRGEPETSPASTSSPSSRPSPPATCRSKDPTGRGRGGNEQYLLRPETMLLWRAVSIGCRLEAPELMKGMRSAERWPTRWPSTRWRSPPPWGQPPSSRHPTSPRPALRRPPPTRSPGCGS